MAGRKPRIAKDIKATEAAKTNSFLGFRMTKEIEALFAEKFEDAKKQNPKATKSDVAANLMLAALSEGSVDAAWERAAFEKRIEQRIADSESRIAAMLQKQQAQIQTAIEKNTQRVLDEALRGQVAFFEKTAEALLSFSNKSDSVADEIVRSVSDFQIVLFSKLGFEKK